MAILYSPVICQNKLCKMSLLPAKEQTFQVILEGAYLDGNLAQTDSWDIWGEYFKGGSFQVKCVGCACMYEVQRSRNERT